MAIWFNIIVLCDKNSKTKVRNDMEVQNVLQNVKFVQDQLSNSLTGFIFNYNIVENILHIIFPVW